MSAQTAKMLTKKLIGDHQPSTNVLRRNPFDAVLPCVRHNDFVSAVNRNQITKPSVRWSVTARVGTPEQTEHGIALNFTVVLGETGRGATSSSARYRCTHIASIWIRLQRPRDPNGLDKPIQIGHYALVPERVSGGAVELWDGWSLALPNDCMCERNGDGSWSAWDAARTIDVHIVTVVETTDGLPMTAENVLGREQNTHGAGWIGHVEELVESDEQGEAFRLAIAAAAPNTLMSCWIAYRTEADRQWANRVLGTITVIPATSKRG